MPKKRGARLIAKLPVATRPVGIAVAAGKIFVANSGRFGNQDQIISVLDLTRLDAAH